MYKKQLEKDLQTIFKTKAVRICSAAETLEQDVLCVDIASARTGAQSGRAWARVSGTVAIRGTAAKNLSGFLIKKINEAPAEDVARFWFSGKEVAAQLPIGWELKAYQMDFAYFYKEEYAPVKGILEYAKLVWKFIIGEQK